MAPCLSTPLWAEFFLANFTSLFNGQTVFFLTFDFLPQVDWMALFKVSRIAEINFYLTLPIIGFIVYLLFFLFRISKRKTFFGRKFIVQ